MELIKSQSQQLVEEELAAAKEQLMVLQNWIIMLVARLGGSVTLTPDEAKGIAIKGMKVDQQAEGITLELVKEVGN